LRESAPHSAAATKPGAEVQLDAGAIDPPEPLTGSVLNLGPLIVEHFVLALDPYPRAPGAVLPPEATDSDDQGEASPFAALAALKEKSGKSG
jgi:hypothetical protein